MDLQLYTCAARVVPVPVLGTKRVPAEIIANLAGEFLLPLAAVASVLVEVSLIEVLRADLPVGVLDGLRRYSQ